MTTTAPILFHRSAAVTDWQCPQKRFWNYEYLGRGITPPEHPYELFLGTLIHDGVAAMVHDVPIDEIVSAGVLQLRSKLLEGRELDPDALFLADEQCALAEGLLRGFYRLHWPRIREQYPTVVVCEQELTFDYEIDGGQLRFLSKPDLVVRDTDGQLWVFEWKTTGSNKEEWIHQWETAVQVHAQIRTVEQALGEPVAGCIVQGFYKSYVSQYNRLESIFCYGYHHPGNPPFERPRWAYEYKYGLKKAPVWTKEGGVKKWVEEMPLSLLASQFPQTPPIFVNERMVHRFFQQQGRREIDIRYTRNILQHGYEEGEGGVTDGTQLSDERRQELFDKTFPMHFESCNAYNRPCGYKRLCFGAPVDPLSIGYALRHSHHQLEQDALDAASH